MASHAPANVLTFKAGAAITKGMIVKPGADADHVIKSALGSSKNFGIAMNTVTTAEDLVEVAMPGGGAKVLLGDTVAFGDLVTSDTAGKGVATTSANDRVVAIAMEDGVVGDLISCHVIAGNY